MIYSTELYEDNDIYRTLRFKNHEDWLEGRGTGIGGSDASAAIGRNPWRSNYDLWRLKTHRIQAADISNNERVIYGQQAEEGIRLLYQAKKRDIMSVNYLPDVTLQNKHDTCMLYSPDGLLKELETGRKGILEVKTATPITAIQKEKWKCGKIPDNYFIQILHGLNVTGFDFVDLIAELTYDEDYSALRIYHVERSDVTEELEYVKSGVLKFWDENVIADQEPPVLLPEI